MHGASDDAVRHVGDLGNVAADDFTSQPSGAAGARVACGVIGITGK